MEKKIQPNENNDLKYTNGIIPGFINPDNTDQNNFIITEDGNNKKEKLEYFTE